MIWSDICMIVVIFNIVYWQWICETKKTKDIETETFRDWIFWELSRPRLFETKKFKGCRDRDRPRLSKSCRDRDFFESLANLRIRVRTAVGETEEKETGENIGQGTLEGANISAANIDYTVNVFFKTSTDELSYGGEQLQPLLFQDDISRLATSVWGAQSGNNKMESVMETKLLDFNLDKSCVIVMGSTMKKAEIIEELEEFCSRRWGSSLPCLRKSCMKIQNSMTSLSKLK